VAATACGMNASMQSIPSLDALLKSPRAEALVAEFGRPLTVDALRHVLDNARADMRKKKTGYPGDQTLLKAAHKQLTSLFQPSLQPVINATGVILHTNLGRAPLSADAISTMQAVAIGYSNLEYDLGRGERGSRYSHAEELLVRLTGAESALVVNNNAAALLLTLAALARRRRVVIARTQLIEIGGGFRIPEVMLQSGAILEEIGATNRVHLDDYRQAIQNKPVKLILRAHRSNFQLTGFTGEPSLAELAELAHSSELPLVDDLGSGTLLDTSIYGLAYEPTIQDSLRAGADLVCFSGDKLLGGPQAGIIVGRRELIQKLKKHPLARAVRADKLALAALSSTLLHYLKNEAPGKVPVWQMIAAKPRSLRARAAGWQKTLGRGDLIKAESAIGGGSLPGETLPTIGLAISHQQPEKVMAALRAAPVPIIARILNDQVFFDPRTVLPSQDQLLIEQLSKVITNE
jgi:L-seryl-tRNA(Ser) seleniumtransferase